MLINFHFLLRRAGVNCLREAILPLFLRCIFAFFPRLLTFLCDYWRFLRLLTLCDYWHFSRLLTFPATTDIFCDYWHFLRLLTFFATMDSSDFPVFCMFCIVLHAPALLHSIFSNIYFAWSAVFSVLIHLSKWKVLSDFVYIFVLTFYLIHILNCHTYLNSAIFSSVFS